jgi:hypothetical protein
VAPVTILIGLVLIALGAIGYLPSQAMTALIPAYFGGVLIALGLLALKEKMRKHAMHVAVIVGLLGFLGAGFMASKVALSGTIERPLAFAMQVAMALVCAVFVGLCVRSFIAARRRRLASAQKT